ncbi:hypothetical protein GGI20_002927 [Coemansia sp. BCRC 34301]|nr:hypothetical protein GGI20_002927 [Coemansia sp. BCRC 34301]
MFINPLLTAKDAENFVKDKKTKYTIVFLPAENGGYLKFREKTDLLVLILLEAGKDGVPFSALANDGLADFKEKKEIFIDEGVVFFVDGEVSIAMKGFDHVEFEKNLAKFKTPKAPTGSGGYSNYIIVVGMEEDVLANPECEDRTAGLKRLYEWLSKLGYNLLIVTANDNPLYLQSEIGYEGGCKMTMVKENVQCGAIAVCSLGTIGVDYIIESYKQYM